jgi:branched-subunit amino acid transport protein
MTSTWLVIALLTLVIFVSRNLFVIFGVRFQLKSRLSQALDFAPLAALVAIVVPEFVISFESHGLSIAAHLVDGRMFAGIAAIAVGVISRNSLYALVSGAICYLVLSMKVFH